MVVINGNYNEINHSDYVEYVIPSGEYTYFRVENNDTFSNIHINREATGAGAEILTILPDMNIQDNWEISNIGITGVQPDGGDYTLKPACTSQGLISNVWAGDGHADYPTGPHDGAGFAWAPREHSGHVTIEKCYVKDFVNNGWYLSAPGDYTSSGTFDFSNCYTRNCHIALYRLGGNTSPGTDRIDNCYGYTSSNDHRCMWVYDGADYVEINDCEFEANGTYAIVSNGYCEVSNSSYTNSAGSGTIVDQGGNDNNPVEFIPAGCPTTAEEAYTGGSSGGGTSDTLDPVDPSPYDATIVYRNEDGETNSDGEYPRFYHQTDGELIETDDYDTQISETVWQENPDEWHATGDVDYRQAFRYNYSTLGLEVDDPIVVEINGQRVDPADYGSPNKEVPPSDDDPNMDRLIEETFDHNSLTEYYDGDTDEFSISEAEQ